MSFLEKFESVNTFVFDIDGVMTNGDLLCTPEGEIWRSMNAKDGYAIQSILKNGYNIAIITSGRQHGVLRRLEKIGVNLIFKDAWEKEKILTEFVKDKHLNLEHVLYMGDDIPDYKVMKMCGVKCCPNDAVPEIKAIADYISILGGGKGCVREVVEKVLRVQDKWFIPD